MRIGIVGASDALSASPTGVGYYIRGLVFGLLELELTDVHLYLYLPPASTLSSSKFPRPKSPKNVHFFHRPSWIPYRFSGVWVAIVSRLHRLDVLYSTAFYHALSTWARGRKVTTVFDVIFKDSPQFYTEGTTVTLDIMVRKALARAAGAVVCSGATKIGVQHHYNFKGETIVAGGAARPQFFSRAECSALPESLADLREPFFLCTGRLDLRKNVVGVIIAYRRLLREGFACSLVLAGPPDSGSEELHQTLSENREESEQIFCPGYVSEAELITLYRRALAFVFPSFAEGFGLPVLEALACGTPTIASNVSPTLEILGDAGLLVDPGSVDDIFNAMKRVLADAELRQRLQEQGPLRAASFRWTDSAHGVLAGFRHL